MNDEIFGYISTHGRGAVRGWGWRGEKCAVIMITDPFQISPLPSLALSSPLQTSEGVRGGRTSDGRARGRTDVHGCCAPRPRGRLFHAEADSSHDTAINDEEKLLGPKQNLRLTVM